MEDLLCRFRIGAAHGPVFAPAIDKGGYFRFQIKDGFQTARRSAMKGYRQYAKGADDEPTKKRF